MQILPAPAGVFYDRFMTTRNPLTQHGNIPDMRGG
jgi:hypothetical protein